MYLQLTLWQWGAGNVYLLVLSSWKVNIAENQIAVGGCRYVRAMQQVLKYGFCKKSLLGVKSLGGHFACLCRGFEFYEVKKKKFVIIFQKENGNTFTLLIIFIVKSLQKGQNSTNLLLWPPICRNKSAITPKWFNSLDTNSSFPNKNAKRNSNMIWYIIQKKMPYSLLGRWKEETSMY